MVDVQYTTVATRRRRWVVTVCDFARPTETHNLMVLSFFVNRCDPSLGAPLPPTMFDGADVYGAVGTVSVDRAVGGRPTNIIFFLVVRPINPTPIDQPNFFPVGRHRYDEQKLVFYWSSDYQRVAMNRNCISAGRDRSADQQEYFS